MAATLMLGLAVGSASARTFSSSSQTLRATFASVELAAGELTIRCRATLEGSLHSSSIAKVARSLIGAVTRAIVGRPCTGGEAWADNGVEAPPGGTINRLPFHLTYESFSGSLPAISSIGLLYSRFSFVIAAGGACTARYGNATDNLGVTSTREASGAITGLSTVVGRDRVTLVTRIGGIFCPERGGFAAVGSPVVLNSGNRITITLI